MRGASDEPAVSAISPPKTRNTIRSGASQSFFRARMKAQSSRSRFIVSKLSWNVSPGDQKSHKFAASAISGQPPKSSPPTVELLTTWILGLSAFYHDSAACLIADGEILAAAQEERFTRVKGDAAFPANAVSFCLGRAGIQPTDLAAVAFHEKPLLKLDRLLESYLALAPRGLRSFLKAAPLWLNERVHTDSIIRSALTNYTGPVLYPEHHESHAASAYYPSPFSEAAILTVDGVGEWATATIGRGVGADLELSHELRYPDSLGLLYSAFTYHAGFKVNSGEYKLMGLAPYGEPRFVQRILDEIVDLRDDGSFTLDQRYFDYIGGLTMTSSRFAERFEGGPRAPESPLTQREMDFARSVQVVCEEVVLRMVRTAHRETGCRALCLAGGVALNAVANGRVLREGPFRDVWIQPAAGDAGAAVGAALLAWHRWMRADRTPAAADAMQGCRLGPSFEALDIEQALIAMGASYIRLDEPELLSRTASMLADGKIVGWFDGRMEFGPRALGARSILADPRVPAMQSILNQKIKFRESFRPFAPSVLVDRATEYFELEQPSPYMLVVLPLRQERRRHPESAGAQLSGLERINQYRSDVPAITHLDYSARVQTVDADRTPRFHALLQAFERLTGCPMVVNTSFNVRGEPIVCTPSEAYACFMRTAIDALVVYPFLLLREEQEPNPDVRASWQHPLPPD
jgi:carbamoyltransferase